MPKFKDLSGLSFGSWKALRFLGKNENGHSIWECENIHGVIRNITNSHLNRAKKLNYKKTLRPIGHKILSKLGYILIKMPDHPRAKKDGYVFEHIPVMEKKLGRSLLPNENVHHLYGERIDNRPENLELWTISQPPGQRVEDKIKWAIEFLKEYGYKITKFLPNLTKSDFFNMETNIEPPSPQPVPC